MDPSLPDQNPQYRPEATPQPAPAQPATQNPEPYQTQQPAPQPQSYQQPYQQPSAPQQPAAVPGKTLGIVAFVLSLLGGGLISLVLGIIAKSQSKKAGAKNGFALAAIIISVVGFIVVTGLIVLTVGLAGYANVQLQERCQKAGPGTHVDGSLTYTCDANSQPVSGSASSSSSTTFTPNDMTTGTTQ